MGRFRPFGLQATMLLVREFGGSHDTQKSTQSCYFSCFASASRNGLAVLPSEADPNKAAAHASRTHDLLSVWEDPEYDDETGSAFDRYRASRSALYCD